MILVTGASGYLGRHVLALLGEGEIDCMATSHRGTVGLRCDLTDSLDVRALFGIVKPTRVIHCAARVPKSAPDYGDGLAAAHSLAMVRHLAEMAPCPITFASSMTADYNAGGYARGKFLAERVLLERAVPGDVMIRLPGLFGAPRQSGALYNAALAFLTDKPFVLDTIPSSWAAMDVNHAAECMVAGKYTGPMEPMDLRAAISLVALECGTEWGDGPGEYDPAFVRAVRDMVTWVRESVVKQSTERTARSCRRSSAA